MKGLNLHMTLTELAAQYRTNSLPLKERINLLSTELDGEKLSETEKFRLRGRIATLLSMYRDMNEAALVMERYYDRGYKRNGRYSI